MSTNPSREMLTVGKITGCYGIKGWVKVHAYTEPQENFLEFKQWYVKRRGELEPLPVDQGKSHGKGLVAHIEGVDDRTLAESYKGLEILASQEMLPDLEEGEYYWQQLLGLAVWCQSGTEKILLGNVDYLIETGANDVLVVKSSEDSIDDRERLIPYLPGKTVVRVDLDMALIEVDWFLDEE
jgi:16S rRNA processing protein RimM